MVDSRAKGQRGEYQVRDLLRKYTNLEWERVPGSGMFGKQHKLKGDIYLPNKNGVHCIEVKSYADDAINCNLLNDSESNLEKWWSQAVREGIEMNQAPVLVFKKDRGKWMVAVNKEQSMASRTGFIFWSTYTKEDIYIYLFEDWLKEDRAYINV